MLSVTTYIHPHSHVIIKETPTILNKNYSGNKIWLTYIQKRDNTIDQRILCRWLSPTVRVLEVQRTIF